MYARPRGYRSYVSSDEEVSAALRIVRLDMGLTLREAAAIVGVDNSHLSKAERGVEGFSKAARRGLASLAAERERRTSEEPESVREEAYEIRVEIRIPGCLQDVVDRVREDVRSKRFEHLRDAFSAHNVEVVRFDSDLDKAFANEGAASINLDSLIFGLMSPASQTPQRRRANWRHLLRFRSVTDPSDVDFQKLEREVNRAVEHLNTLTEDPMT